MARKPEDYVATSLARGLTLLAAFSHARPEMTLSEMSEVLSVSRSAAYRIVMTLEHLGFIEKNSRGRSYRLTSRVLDLGYAYLMSLDLIERLTPLLEELRNVTGFSVHMGRLEGVQVVYVYRAPSRLSLVSNVPTGTRLPAHATAMGRALLSALSVEAVTALFQDQPPEAFSEQMPTGTLALLRLLDADRARGYVVNRGTFAPGTVAIAAPLRDRQGNTVAAVNVSGPESIMSEEDIAERLPGILLDYCRRMSALL